MTNAKHHLKAAAHHRIPHVEQIALEACILVLTLAVALLAIAA